jgi:hypothetical protein
LPKSVDESNEINHCRPPSANHPIDIVGAGGADVDPTIEVAKDAPLYSLRLGPYVLSTSTTDKEGEMCDIESKIVFASDVEVDENVATLGITAINPAGTAEPLEKVTFATT